MCPPYFCYPPRELADENVQQNEVRRALFSSFVFCLVSQQQTFVAAPGRRSRSLARSFVRSFARSLGGQTAAGGESLLAGLTGVVNGAPGAECLDRTREWRVMKCLFGVSTTQLKLRRGPDQSVAVYFLAAGFQMRACAPVFRRRRGRVRKACD